MADEGLIASVLSSCNRDGDKAAAALFSVHPAGCRSVVLLSLPSCRRHSRSSHSVGVLLNTRQMGLVPVTGMTPPVNLLPAVNNPEYSDATLGVEGDSRTMFVHRGILCARCPCQ